MSMEIYIEGVTQTHVQAKYEHVFDLIILVTKQYQSVISVSLKVNMTNNIGSLEPLENYNHKINMDIFNINLLGT